MMSEQIRGGIIRVSRKLTDELGITIEETDKDTDIFAMIKERFLLPENYTIKEVFSYPITSTRDMGVWGIFVESPDLPVITSDKWPPILTPIHTRDANGHVQLVEVKVEDAVTV